MKRKNWISRVNYNRKQNSRAQKIIRAMSEQGEYLSANTIKLCNDYAHDVLGGKEFSPWLQAYSSVSGQFKEGWIPDNFYFLNVMPFLKGRFSILSDFGTLSNGIFNIKDNKSIATMANGMLFDNNLNIIKHESATGCFFDDNERIVFKEDSSLQGKGIHFFQKGNFNLDTLKGLGDGVIEKFINQHPFFNNFTKNSVATIRITTVITDEGAVEARVSYLRLAGSNDTHVKSASSIRVPINMSSGELYDIGYDAKWKRHNSHPASNKKFSGEIIPNFSECINFVCSLHRKQPFVRVIGWDVIIDDNEKPVFIEWNPGHNNITTGEATVGPCFTGLNWERFR